MAVLLMRFPYSIEQGILCAEQSVLGREQGIPLPKREAIAGWISDMHNVVKDPDSNSCAVIDSVMDIDYAAGRIAYESANAVIAFIQEKQLKLEWLIETHLPD